MPRRGRLGRLPAGAEACSIHQLATVASEEAMIVYNLTLDEFIACPQDPVDGIGETFATLHPDIIWMPGTEIVVTTNPKYATALPSGCRSFADLVLLERLSDSWKIVGGYIHTNLLIDGEARRRGLSRELILRTAEHRPIPKSRLLTKDGHAALSAAHKYSVHQAVAAELVVPKAVREYYGL
jgi:hypothetical protein